MAKGETSKPAKNRALQRVPLEKAKTKEKTVVNIVAKTVKSKTTVKLAKDKPVAKWVDLQPGDNFVIAADPSDSVGAEKVAMHSTSQKVGQGDC